MNLPKKLKSKLLFREENKSLRQLSTQNNLVDFSSNDYLGFAKSAAIFNQTHQFLVDNNLKINGATGSRLLSGNHNLYNKVETFLADFHQVETVLIFNSGYDANIGFFSSVPQKGDIILYDEFIHASIRDGIRLSNAKSFKFKHNNLEELEEKILRQAQNDKYNQTDIGEIYVVTESVFSMDGDSPDLVKMVQIAKKHNAFFIVDEAHAIGVFGNKGCGKIQKLNLENDVFARIITFGKALGCHGAAILGSADLKSFLINFARSFIYTTGLSPHSLATIQTCYSVMKNEEKHQKRLLKNITFFTSEIKKNNLENLFIKSNSAIHCCVISGNENVKSIAKKLHEKGFDVKAVLSPTVAKNRERLRFCLHSYNSEAEIKEVLHLLATFV